MDLSVIKPSKISRKPSKDLFKIINFFEQLNSLGALSTDNNNKIW